MSWKHIKNLHIYKTDLISLYLWLISKFYEHLTLAPLLWCPSWFPCSQIDQEVYWPKWKGFAISHKNILISFFFSPCSLQRLSIFKILYNKQSSNVFRASSVFRRFLWFCHQCAIFLNKRTLHVYFQTYYMPHFFPFLFFFQENNKLNSKWIKRI